MLYAPFIYFWAQINLSVYLGLSPFLKQSRSISVLTSPQATGGTVGFRFVRPVCRVTGVEVTLLHDEDKSGTKAQVRIALLLAIKLKYLLAALSQHEKLVIIGYCLEYRISNSGKG